MLGLSLLFSLSLPATPPDAWDPLRQQLDDWVLTDNFAVTIGDATGPLFQYTHGNFTLDARIGTASTSKWPLAMMFVGLVADGTIRSLDAKASEYVKWWATDAGDPKSQVTLRQLLSFTSGFGTGAPGQENSSDLCMDSESSDLDFNGCAHEVYLATNLSGTPGKTYTYNSVHLQLAGAVAMSASGLGIQVRRARRCTSPFICMHAWAPSVA
jgi:CubicO group peptidase (beta-lactamase class C family)